MSKWYLLIVAVVFSIATIWMPYSAKMWGLGHYQYFPLLLTAVASLLWTRRDAISLKATDPVKAIFLVGLIAVSVFAFLGHLLYSPLIGIFTTILGLVVLLYGAFGAGGIMAAAPVLWLLVFAMPLPLGWDQSLILKMQFFASRLASLLLDGLGVLHFRQGVILITEKSQFMTEEACSGVRSLFSSLAVVGVYSVVLRHRLLRVVLNMLQTVVWVLLGNAIRLVAVVILADNVDRWYATGTGHEMLGIGAFIFILGMVISTDALLTFLVYGPATEDFDETIDGPDIVDSSEAEESFDFPLRPRVTWMVACVFVIVGFVGLRVAFVRESSLQPIDLASLPSIPEPMENDLPAVLDGWQRVSFEHVEREVSMLLAKDSFVWRYTKGNTAAVVSVDCPWAEWHNLWSCYTALGWNVKPQYFVPNDRLGNEIGKPVTQSELRMSKANRNGFVFFTVLDRSANEIVPSWQFATRSFTDFSRALLQQSAQSLGLGLEAQFAIGGRQLPATTIQMLIESSEPFTDAQVDDLRKLYDSVRQTLMKSQRWSSAKSQDI